jgi:hypothetical protein
VAVDAFLSEYNHAIGLQGFVGAVGLLTVIIGRRAMNQE